jgi:hypothetical protein
MERPRRQLEKGFACVKTLRDIETEVAALARHLGAAGEDLPSYGISHDFGRPHIEVENVLYYYVVVERGEELERRSTESYDELLYWIFRDVTHKLAFSREIMNRVEDQDCRRIAFPKQIELMKRISSTMCTRLEGDIADILRRARYDDEPTKAVNRIRGSGSK